MGMLVNGQWSEQDNIIVDGAYIREESLCRAAIEVGSIIKYPGRYHLIASWSCPWSHRTMLIRQVVGLSDHVPLHITGGPKIEGYSADHGNPWKIPGTESEIIHMHQLYSLSDTDYTGRSTVPILWDSHLRKIISNESTHIMQIFDRENPNRQAATRANPTAALYTDQPLIPVLLKTQILELNDEIYCQLSNAVYRAGFAELQSAYDEAVQQVFNMLQRLNARLATSRFLLADQPTLADWLLLPNLVRFDIDYYLHSRCCLARLTDYPHLWAYARDLYNLPGISDTVNFAAIHQSNYSAGDILPLIPKADWQLKADREHLSSDTCR
ncbi:MAG: glutathione S-transferase C-terminal domain-containing protein [Pseudomonadales bacterium]|nr:glutathione S-transferase C-terminal domain-containing protein [Pseudomonadales bacterium]NRA15397.1 glutathione S-transferase C-terminal domain-containing protein [Oceanospirillaceae bacterium]